MKYFRVCIEEVTYGTVHVQAENKEDAETFALKSADVEWNDESHAEVTEVSEVDENGDELPE